MSHLLDTAARLDPQRCADLAANDAQRRAFLVQLKAGKSVIHEFGAMGTDALAVAAEYDGLKGPGQYLRVVPASRKEEPFPVVAARQELETAQTREAIPEAERIAADIAEDVAKGARRHALADRVALDLQLNGSGVR